MLLFLDLFGVNLLPDPQELASTIGTADQLCGWLPSEAASQVSDMVMRALVPSAALAGAAAMAAAGPGGASTAPLGIVAQLGGELRGRAMSTHKGVSSAAVDDTLHAASTTHAAQPAAGDGDVALVAQQLQLLPASASASSYPGLTRLPYLAAHIRRSDWFYYCAGQRDCFQSISRVARCLNATLASLGLGAIYIATNSDAREREMLQRGISGRVLFWEDVAHTARRQQLEERARRRSLRRRQRALLGEVEAPGGGDTLVGAQAGPEPEAAGAEPGVTGLPLPLPLVDLDDPLMVQIVEKAICAQVGGFGQAGRCWAGRARWMSGSRHCVAPPVGVRLGCWGLCMQACSPSAPTLIHGCRRHAWRHRLQPRTAACKRGSQRSLS